MTLPALQGSIRWGSGPEIVAFLTTFFSSAATGGYVQILNLLVLLKKDPSSPTRNTEQGLAHPKMASVIPSGNVREVEMALHMYNPISIIAACWQSPVTDCTQLYPTLTSDAIYTNLCLSECLPEVAGWRRAHCTCTPKRLSREKISASL